MKYLIKVALFLSVSMFFGSCGSKNTKLEGVTPGALDSVSYAVGRSLGVIVRDANLGDLNYKELARGIKDVVEQSDEVYDKENYDTEIERYLQKREEFMRSVRTQEADEFFEKNGKKPEVSVTETGLQYSIIEAGSGIMPMDSDTVALYYEVSLMDGTIINSNFGKESVTLSMEDMISGWKEGLRMIGERGRIKLWVPAALAYGERGFGAIPPDSPIFCELEITSVKNFVEEISEETEKLKESEGDLPDGGERIRLN